MNEDGGEDPMGIDRWSRALSWHAALREADEKELTNSVGREWQDWCADAENRRVFDNVSRLLADRDLYHKRPRRSKEELDGDSYDLSVPIAEWRRTRALENTRLRRSFAGNRWWWLSVGIGVAAIVALIVLWPPLLGLGGDPNSAVTYQTGVGELKDVHLADGSSIILGGRTEVSAAVSARRRSVTVIEGEAWFKIAHDPRRPFVVTAGDGKITDLGTAFLVRRESDRVTVMVTEGAVEVSARPHSRLPLKPEQRLASGTVLATIRVARGEELTFGDNGALSPVKQTDAQAVTAWTHGRFTFDDQPLRYVIEVINRYSSQHIVVSPSAGALRFSGIVFKDEIGDWLRSLAVIFPVTVEEQGQNVGIQLRQSSSAVTDLQPKAQRKIIP